MDWEDFDWTFCAKADDTDVFLALYHAYYKKIFWTAHSLLNDVSTAEEIVRETFLIAWKRLDTLESPCGFSAWMEEIASNLCRSFLDNTLLIRSETS